LIKQFNEEAKKLYLHEVKGGKKWDNAENIRLFLGYNDFDAQRYYVETRLKQQQADGGIQHARPTLLRMLRENKYSGKKIWLIGEAGIGKTTILYRTYFDLVSNNDKETEQYPVPLLMQPKALNEKSIKRLTQCEDEDFFYILLDIWLSNRNIPVSIKEESIASVEFNIKQGKIAVLLDSYDELDRMDFQINFFEKLSEICPLLICATRPEADKSRRGDIKLRIEYPWDIETIKTYLENRLSPDKKKYCLIIYNYILQDEKKRWLRNPRYLDLIINVLEKIEGINDYNFSAVLSKKEFGFFDEVYKMSIERLERSCRDKEYKFDETKLYNIRQRFIELAEYQLKKGVMQINTDQKDDIWDIITRDDFIIELPPNSKHSIDGTDFEVRLSNYNWIDYFLTSSIADKVYETHSNLDDYDFLWSNSLVTYLEQKIAQRIENGKWKIEHVKSSIKEKIEKCSLTKDEKMKDCGYRDIDKIPPKNRFLAINLINLLIKIEMLIINQDNQDKNLSDEQLRIRTKLCNWDFDNLNLESVDFTNIAFYNCNFTGSILKNAFLDKAVFEECIFNYINLQNSSCSLTKFVDCHFNFYMFKKYISPVRDMVIQDSEFELCNKETENFDDELTGDDFLRFEAKGMVSRYSGEFGKKFREIQKAFLGRGLKKAETKLYMNAIKEHIDLLQEPKKSNIYIIDMMIGGSNKRLRDLMMKDNLYVLGIDRDTSQMEDILSDAGIGKRLSLVQKEINGLMGLENIVKENWSIDTVDLIIGKKALHELKRENQKILLEECWNVLASGGKLILFADAPDNISNAGVKKFDEYVGILRNLETSNEKIREKFIEELKFSDLHDDCALFSNLWVLLKDWANENIHELNHRYFSSIQEIKKWASEIGFKIAGEPQKENYKLIARLYNERGINRAGIHLERNNDQIKREDEKYIKEALIGTEKHGIFYDFAEKHLFCRSQNLNQLETTALGKALGATRENINYGKIHEGLKDLELPYNDGAGFDFSIYVIVFEKE
jgi:uncharacterized protein YjbI with pentapeptide repeats/SAM-dependent methyltransferase